MKNLEAIKEEIINILQKNKEELKHAQDTLKFLLLIKPNSDFCLKIAALSHDIERAVKSWEVKDYKLDKEFRMAHSKRSAEIVKNILEKNNIDKKEIERILNLILNHEFGGGESDILRDADSLANFIWCDDMFGKEDIRNLKETMEKMYKRMSDKNRKFISQIKFKNKEIENILKEICSWKN